MGVIVGCFFLNKWFEFHIILFYSFLFIWMGSYSVCCFHIRFYMWTSANIHYRSFHLHLKFLQCDCIVHHSNLIATRKRVEAALQMLRYQFCIAIWLIIHASWFQMCTWGLRWSRNVQKVALWWTGNLSRAYHRS